MDSQKDVLTRQNFEAIKRFILAQGDRFTYCNMYNHNPRYQFGGFEAFLTPEIGQGNINCDPARSDFNEIVIRDWSTEEVYFSAKSLPEREWLMVEVSERSRMEAYFERILAVL